MDFTVKFLSNFSNIAIKGDITQFSNGVATFSNGKQSSKYDSFEEFKELNPGADVELVPDSPRICYILGGQDTPLKVGEKFSFEYCGDLFHDIYVGGDGDLYGMCHQGALTYIINHPEKIIRQPQFSDDEKALIKAITDLGFWYIARDESGELYMFQHKPHKEDLGIFNNDDREVRNPEIPTDLFPQITFGNSPFNAAEYLEASK